MVESAVGKLDDEDELIEDDTHYDNEDVMFSGSTYQEIQHQITSDNLG